MAEIQESLLAILNNLPRSLTETYRRIGSRILAKLRGHELLDMAITTFRWILGSRRPLTLDNTCEAVALATSDKCLPRTCIVQEGVHVLNACSNFVVLDVDGTLRLAHPTVLEYLKGPNLFQKHGLKNERYHDLTNVYDFLTCICKAYINFLDFDV
jgi:hypothetical protein